MAYGLRTRGCHCCGAGLIPGPRNFCTHVGGEGEDKTKQNSGGIRKQFSSRRTELLHKADFQLDSRSGHAECFRVTRARGAWVAWHTCPCIFSHLLPSHWSLYLPPGAIPSLSCLFFIPSCHRHLHFLAGHPVRQNRDAFPYPRCLGPRSGHGSYMAMNGPYTQFGEVGMASVPFLLPSGWRRSCHLGPQDGGQVLGRPGPDVTAGSDSANWLSF